MNNPLCVWKATYVLSGCLFLATLVGLSDVASAQDLPQRPDAAQHHYQVFLLGNTGAGTPSDLAPTLTLLRQHLQEAGEEAAVVFLGDQLPCCGMPEQQVPERAEAEAHLQPIIEAVKGFSGEVYFIPGDLDHGSGEDRLAALERQEAFLEEALGRGNVFLPDGEFPGPIDVKLADDLRLLLLNTDWMLQEEASPTGEMDDYDIQETQDVYLAVEDLIYKRKGDDLIIVGHHPILSNGRYAGHAPPYYLIPALGTAAFAAKRTGGDEQYFSHERNEWMRHRLKDLFNKHEDYIYVAAHDLSLQHFDDEKINKLKNYAVSGSAAVGDYVAKRYGPDDYDTRLTTRQKGYLSLHYYIDGSVWLDAWAVQPDGTGRRIHEQRIRRAELYVEDAAGASHSGPEVDFRGQTATIVPEPKYDAGWFRHFLFGKNLRDVWTTPVTAPYFDMGMEQGGLTPIKRGGGMQTTSIRFESPEGKQYVLRSVNKDGPRSLPIEWQRTFMAPIIQDLLSYSHPFSAVPVPKMADAIGVYHANPRLVYMPSDPRLGMFQDLVADTLVLFEERPNGDMSDEPSFGSSEDVVGWTDVYRDVSNDSDNRIDTHFFARNRLFDMWLSDWDRHKDQWRWSTFDDTDGKGTLFRPIPRDRDNAFNRLNPALGPLVKPFMKFQDFRNSYGNLKGLGTNGRQQDHRFLSGLSREEWIGIADSIQHALTDDVIESGLRDLPPASFEVNGLKLIEVGKVRRDKLQKVADKYYRLHARSVDVVGTHKHERFEVTRLPDGDTEVVMYKTTKEGEIRNELYRRVIHRNETREINLYGLGGEDTFIVQGEARRGTRVNVVGGPGADTFVDESHVAGSGKKTRFYDTESEGNRFEPGRETRVKQSEDPEYNAYAMRFEYERHYPFALGYYNPDDGLVLQGSFKVTRHAFQKEPVAREHQFSLYYATLTKAFVGQYNGDFYEVIGDWNLGVDLRYYNPNNIYNFFGLGNETEKIENKDLFRTRLGGFIFDAPISQEFEEGITFSFAPRLEMFDLNDADTLLLNLKQPGLAPLSPDPQWFLGFRSHLDLTYKDDPSSPWWGYVWKNSVGVNWGVENAPDSYVTVASALAMYASLPARRQYTLAVRAGGAHTFGTFPYYGANTLGGTDNLRGFRSTRFAGRSSVYINTDARLELFTIKKGFFPGRLGALAAFDTGRVWTDEESSTKWHQGFGVGLWYDIVNEFVINFTQSWSVEEGNYTLIGVGFAF